MTKNTEKYVKIQTQSFIDMGKKIELLESHVAALRAENEILRDENETNFETCNDLIQTIRTLRLENEKLHQEIEDEIAKRIANLTIWDLSEEAQAEAGHALARSLLGKPMTHEDLAIESAENGYKPYSGDDF